MNYFDLIVILILCYAIYKGFTKGLIFELSGLVALILGIWGAVHFSNYTAQALQPHFHLSSKLLFYTSLAITFLIIVLLVSLIAKLVDKLVKALALGFLNRLGGILFSLSKMLLLLSIFIFFLNGINSKFHFLSTKTTQKSYFYQPLTGLSKVLVPEIMYLKSNSLNKVIP